MRVVLRCGLMIVRNRYFHSHALGSIVFLSPVLCFFASWCFGGLFVLWYYQTADVTDSILAFCTGGMYNASFYSARNARIASAVLATAIPSVRPSVRHTPVLC